MGISDLTQKETGAKSVFTPFSNKKLYNLCHLHVYDYCTTTHYYDLAQSVAIATTYQMSFVFIVIYICGAKFEEHCSIISGNILYSVFYDTVKYGDVHEKFNFLKIQDYDP